MRIFFLLYLSVFFNNIALAQKVNPILQCLGKEELIHHKKKIRGPGYFLNQDLINLFVNMDHLQINPEVIKRVCYNKKFTPSLALIKEMIFNPDGMFFKHRIFKNPYKDPAFSKVVISRKTPEIFIHYLSKLQALTKDPKCLAREIPETKTLLRRFQNLQDDAPPSWLMDKDKVVNRIFRRLENFNDIYKRCYETSINKTKL